MSTPTAITTNYETTIASNPPPSETEAHIESIETIGLRMKALLLACMGQKTCNNTSDDPLFVPTVSPWSELHKQDLVIQRQDCIAEINRRWDKKLFETARAYDFCRPRPNQWKMPKLLLYLDKYRIDVPGDVQYLASAVTTETIKAKNVLKVRTQVAATLLSPPEDEQAKKPGGGQNWVGKIPLLRLIHCLVDDQDIIQAFRKRADLPSGRVYVDNRKSDGKLPRNVYESLAEKWNNVDYTCCTIAITGPASHDLAVPIVIDYTQIQKFKKATPGFLKEKISDVIREVVRVESNWKKSGEGEGALKQAEDTDDDDDDDSSNEDYSAPAPDSNPAMMHQSSHAIDLSEKARYAKKSYVLYWWHMLETSQLMKSSRQRLNETVAAGQHSSLFKVPDVSWKSSWSIKDGKDGTQSIGDSTINGTFALAESVTTMAYAARYVGDMEAQDREKARTVSMYTQDQQSRIAIASRADSITTSIDKLQNEKRQLQRDLLKLQCEELDICDGDDSRRVKRLKLEIDLLQSQVADIELQCIKKQEIVTALLQQETQVDILTPTRNKNRTPRSAGTSTLASDEFSLGLEVLNVVQRDLGLTDFTA